MAHDPQTERPAEVLRVQANASVNRLFIAACDRHGVERGVSWVQGSVIVDADGYPLAGPAEQGGEQILLATLNLAEARNKRISEGNDLHHVDQPSLQVEQRGAMNRLVDAIEAPVAWSRRKTMQRTGSARWSRVRSRQRP